jgi:transposase
MRARVLLATDYSQGTHIRDADVAASVRVSATAVRNIRKRYVDDGLSAALYDKPRPGAAPKITGEAEAHLIALSCSEPPEGQSRWTLRLLADKLVELKYVESISTVAVHQRLKKAI